MAEQEQHVIAEMLKGLNEALGRFHEYRQWFTDRGLELAHDGKAWRLATPEEVASYHAGQQLEESLKAWKPRIKVTPHQHDYQITPIEGQTIIRCCRSCGQTDIAHWTKISVTRWHRFEE